MPKYLKIIIGILFAAAVALGLLQRNDKLLGVRQRSYVKQQAPANDQSPEYFYTTGQALKTATPQTATTTFVAGGDIMLSRNVAAAIAKANDPLLPFKGIDAILRSSDFNFANLESPFSGRNDFPQTGSLVFNAPTANVQGLQDYNFKIVNLANNHAMDQGQTGISFTNKWLDQHFIAHIGTGATLADAWTPQIVESKGIRIGFIGASFSSLNDGGKTKNNLVARIEDTARLKTAITELKPKSDFIVVTMHAGTEYTRTPNASQIAFAHAAIDDGADMVIGAHPHWIQTTEQYKDKYIFYSLGNLIFDQEWSQETKEGLLLKISLSKPAGQTVAQLQQIEYIPIILEKYCCPRPTNPTETQAILKKISVPAAIITAPQ